MGVFGKKTNHVTHRIVNSKYNYESQSDGTVKITANKNYDSKAPTYIQIYDDRLVNADNLSDKELIKAYDKLNTDNHLEINNHNDTVVPYSFRVDSDAYKRNVEILNEYIRAFLITNVLTTKAVKQQECSLNLNTLDWAENRKADLKLGMLTLISLN